jgi:hypothetical protein
MKCIVAVALMANAVMAQQAQLKGPIKVFILAGQSNMEGQGAVSMDGERDYNGGKIVTICCHGVPDLEHPGVSLDPEVFKGK